jgi:GNAT superfamily N-acetyltransferase
LRAGEARPAEARRGWHRRDRSSSCRRSRDRCCVGQNVVGAEWRHRNRDLWQRLGVGLEAGAEFGEIGNGVGIELGIDGGREIGLTAALVGQSQGSDDELAGSSLWQCGHGDVVEPTIGVAWEELVSVDQAGQRHGLGSQRVNDMAVVDDMGAAAITVAATAGQRHQRCAAEEDLKPVVVEPHAEPVTDQPRGHGVEDAPQHEASGRGDGHHCLLTVFRPSGRQRAQNGPFGVDALAVAGVPPADQFVNEAAILGDGVEVARAPQEQRVLHHALEMT